MYEYRPTMTTAVSCTNNMGSFKSEELDSLTKDIWSCAQVKTYAHIAGTDNVESDAVSRQLYTH